MNIEFNLIAVFDSNCKHILMCKRRKYPYKDKGLYNLVGGKIENEENGLSLLIVNWKRKQVYPKTILY